VATKANAHFVDCDINPDSLSWSCEGQGIATTYTLTWINENGLVWAIPLGDQELLGGLDAGGVAVNVGGGVVGLPYAGHPFAVGQSVRIYGTTNYEGVYTLQASTTTTRLDILDTYVSETFDGSEQVVRVMTTDAGAGRMARDSSGNLYVGHNWNAGNATYITKIASDGTITYDDFTWPAGVGVAGKTVLGLKISADSSDLYVMTGADGYVLKFDIATGVADWYKQLGSNGYELDIDADGNAYLSTGWIGTYPEGLASEYPTRRLESSDGAWSTLTEMGQVDPYGVEILGGLRYAVVVDDTLGIVMIGGQMSCLANQSDAVKNTMYNVAVRTFDDSAGGHLRLGDLYASGASSLTYGVYTGCLASDGTNIFALTGSAGATTILYKLAWDGASLTQVHSAAGPVYGVGLFVDLYGNVVVVNQDYSSGQEDVFYYYDTDLNYLGKVDGVYPTMLKQWDAPSGGSWLQGNVLFNGVVGSDSATSDQSRALWYPSDWSHLDGETVQVLGDGAYLGTDTVASGAITLDDNTTTNHVGLAYTSYLQPMKPDGEVYVKGINEILVQLYNSLGGKYSETLDRLWQIIFRDRDDDFGDSSALFSGYKLLTFDGTYTRKGDVWIVQDIPLPMTVLGLVLKMLIEDGSK